MEHAVHENILRQARTRGNSKKHPPGHWSENNSLIMDESMKFEPLVATEPICELSDSYDSELHQPSFSDISSFFEDRDCQPPQEKRVKLEPSNGNSVNGEQEEEEEEELNDDDFDEDAASENEMDERNKHNENSTVTPDPRIFTIEVLDDDDEMAALPVTPNNHNSSSNNNNSNNRSISSNKSNCSSLKSEPETKPNIVSDLVRASELPFKYISMDAATNTETANGHDTQDDADRMFLLSLMPFLQRLDERRKLRVRQKLQNVLIEELEFGWSGRDGTWITKADWVLCAAGSGAVSFQRSTKLSFKASRTRI